MLAVANLPRLALLLLSMTVIGQARFEDLGTFGADDGLVNTHHNFPTLQLTHVSYTQLVQYRPLSPISTRIRKISTYPNPHHWHIRHSQHRPHAESLLHNSISLANIPVELLSTIQRLAEYDVHLYYHLPSHPLFCLLEE